MSARSPILFGAAALVLAVGELADVQSLGATSAEQIRHYLAAPGLLDVACAAFVAGSILLILAVGSAWADVQGRGGTLVRVGLGMIGVGAVWYPASRVGGDITDLQMAHLPVATQLRIMDTTPGWISLFDPPATIAWLLGPIVYWIGLRRARRAHWLLLVVYVVAAAVETAFAFVSLPIEALTCLVAIGTVAAMSRPAVPARVPALSAA